MSRGIVYVLTNRSMPGLIKVGKTQRYLGERLRELNTTGVPTPFTVYLAVVVEDCSAVEKALHRLLEPDRVSSNREFFRTDYSRLYDLLLLLGTEVDYELEGTALLLERALQEACEFDPTTDF